MKNSNKIREYAKSHGFSIIQDDEDTLTISNESPVELTYDHYTDHVTIRYKKGSGAACYFHYENVLEALAHVNDLI